MPALQATKFYDLQHLIHAFLFAYGQHLFSLYFAEPCPPGHYCLPGSSGPIKCPWGTYQPKMGQTSPLACEKCPDFDRLLYTGHDRPVVNITDCPPVEGIDIQHITVRCNFTGN